jgi:hypothetical protein
MLNLIEDVLFLGGVSHELDVMVSFIIHRLPFHHFYSAVMLKTI